MTIFVSPLTPHSSPQNPKAKLFVSALAQSAFGLYDYLLGNVTIVIPQANYRIVAPMFETHNA